MHKCFGCGIEKDINKLEVYPYPDKDHLTTDPIEPLMVLEVEGEAKTFKATVVCFECFSKLDPDMWISENCWKQINPIVSFSDLPLIDYSKDTKWKVESY